MDSFMEATEPKKKNTWEISVDLDVPPLQDSNEATTLEQMLRILHASLHNPEDYEWSNQLEMCRQFPHYSREQVRAFLLFAAFKDMSVV
jgi:hypothetical protein